MLSAATENDSILPSLKDAFGAAWRFLEDSSVTELMLNADSTLWIKAAGRPMHQTRVKIHPTDADTIFTLLAYHEDVACGREAPELSTEIPPHGARFHGWLPPLVERPTFTIRKRAERIFTLDDYVQQGALSRSAKRFLQEQIRNRSNILIAGATNSGKTTFGNALLHEMRETEDRIILIEDTRELQCSAPNSLAIKTSPEFSARRALRGALRMNPDRILLGEVRDASALDLLKAWNTGHPGGLCTIHADSAADSLLRLEDLILEAPGITRVSQRLLSRAIHVLVFLQYTPEGRRVEEILHLNGLTPDGEYDLQPVL